MGKCLFVTGTGTDIGKTYVTALIVKKLRDNKLNASYYKAAISGADVYESGKLLASDALYVNQVANIGEEQSNLVSYVYREAVSPHLAAKLNNNPIDLKIVEQDFNRAKSKYDFLTVEGSGGIICPLRWDDEAHIILDDMVKMLNLSVVIIADAGLGTINSVVLTVEHLKNRDIPIKGVILNNYQVNDIMQEDNIKMIEDITKVPVIAKVENNDDELDIDVDVLKSLYD